MNGWPRAKADGELLHKFRDQKGRRGEEIKEIWNCKGVFNLNPKPDVLILVTPGQR